MSGNSYDVIVIGVGGMGSATVFELARRGRRVLGLEQFSLGHDRGSSHGHTRIIRQAYYEHPDYVPLVRRAYARWYDLEQRVGRHLLTECNCLSIGLPNSELIEGVRRSADEHRLPIDPLSPAEMRERFPMFHFDDSFAGVLERSAGFLYVDDCVRAHIEAARNAGATLLDNEAVRAWHATPGGVTVQTDRANYSAAKLVLTAGPWATRLLAEWGAGLRVMRQVVLWFEPRHAAAFRRDVFPIYITDTAHGYFYGLPMLDMYGVKVAQHYGAAELAGPEQVHRDTSVADETNVRHFLREHLPDADGPCRRRSVCLYTLTPDRHFILDTHPQYPNVAVAAGFSGHGFKFASVVGEIMADLAESGRTAQPIDLFRLQRFGRENVTEDPSPGPAK
jgi:sarcosine oxidase